MLDPVIREEVTVETHNHVPDPVVETPTTDNQVERPAWLPEGFNTPEEFAAAYAELKGKGPAEEAPKADDKPAVEPPKIEEPTPEEKAATEAAEAKGVDVAALEAKFVQDGKLSDEDYADLEKRGFPKSVVDEFIGHRVERAQRMTTELMTEMGGEDTFAAMVEWGKTGLSAADRKAYNDAIDSGDWGRITMASKAVKAAYEEAKGKSPDLVKGSPVKGGADSFASMDEYVKAVADPRYSSDPGYRQSLMDKLARSNI